MKRISSSWLSWLVVFLSMCPCACNSGDADRLARVGRRSAAKIDNLTCGAPNKLANSLEAVRINWDDLTLDTRVSARLRWDNLLTDAQVHVRTLDAGTVELSGTVNDDSQRQRAVQLAQSTVGVDRVVDLLTYP
jgi:hypothetical protein